MGSPCRLLQGPAQRPVLRQTIRGTVLGAPRRRRGGCHRIRRSADEHKSARRRGAGFRQRAFYRRAPVRRRSRGQLSRFGRRARWPRPWRGSASRRRAVQRDRDVGGSWPRQPKRFFELALACSECSCGGHEWRREVQRQRSVVCRTQCDEPGTGCITVAPLAPGEAKSSWDATAPRANYQCLRVTGAARLHCGHYRVR